MGAWPIAQIDHINGDRADNRFLNLREATRTENAWNAKLRSDSHSGFKGVRRHKRRWCAYIKVSGKQKHLGSFATPEEAHDAYCRAAREHHGQFARPS
ncbi:MAG: HNH endonuclease [Beijerinckiaceae bacterium]|nr:HNH endonuclease [Beijerinckiaceae bacterium]